MTTQIRKSIGVILRVSKQGETSKLISIFTRDSGKIQLVAKGARKPLSRLGYALDVGNLVEFVYYFKTDRTYNYLSQVTLLDQFQALKEEISRFKLLACLLEFTELLTPIGEKNLRLFKLLLSALKALQKEKNKAIVLSYALKLLAVQGYKPELKSCVECGKALENESALFAFEKGGLLCSSCISSVKPELTFELRADIIKILVRFICAGFERIKNIRLTDEQIGIVGYFVKTLVSKNAGVSTLKCAVNL